MLKKENSTQNNFEMNNLTNKNARKSLNKKSLEIFKINLLQTQRKKEFERELYDRRYSWDIMSERLKSLYCDILKCKL